MLLSAVAFVIIKIIVFGVRSSNSSSSCDRCDVAVVIVVAAAIRNNNNNNYNHGRLVVVPLVPRTAIEPSSTLLIIIIVVPAPSSLLLLLLCNRIGSPDPAGVVRETVSDRTAAKQQQYYYHFGTPVDESCRRPHRFLVIGTSPMCVCACVTFTRENAVRVCASRYKISGLVDTIVGISFLIFLSGLYFRFFTLCTGCGRGEFGDIVCDTRKKE